MQEVHALFRGTVQGVGFRYTCRQLAQGQGLKGWVRNRPDGSVELMAQGEREALNEYLTAIKTEFAGYISRVEIDWHTPGELWTEFKVKF